MAFCSLRWKFSFNRTNPIVSWSASSSNRPNPKAYKNAGFPKIPQTFSPSKTIPPNSQFHSQPYASRPGSVAAGLREELRNHSSSVSITMDEPQNPSSESELWLYSTMSRKELFKPKVLGKVGMYACGVTAYDLSHIGHARVYVAFNVLYSPPNKLKYHGIVLGTLDG